MPDLLAADLSPLWPTHLVTVPTGKHATHARAHTHTHAHTHGQTPSHAQSKIYSDMSPSLCNACTLYVYLATYILHSILQCKDIVQATLCHGVSYTHSPHLTQHICTSSLLAGYFSGPSHTHLTLTPHPTHSTLHVFLTTTHCPPQQNMYALEEDSEVKVELYTCSPEQNELLGLDQMNVD